ncbi:hypothetical protein QP185_04475 [Sphingomonas aerolata]|uniref:hypothetical protein n=1 Tax=Sphingomonas aerolata TaxID=185951 RepID=UPI002FDFA0FF
MKGFATGSGSPTIVTPFVFASCLVRQQPVLATRLFQSEPGSLFERGLIQTIIVQGRECVGHASRVTVEPSLVRVYIMDAFTAGSSPLEA